MNQSIIQPLNQSVKKSINQSIKSRSFAQKPQFKLDGMPVPAAFKIMKFPHYARANHETLDAQTIKERYRELARSAHPDAGGSQEAFSQLVEAYEVCLNYLLFQELMDQSTGQHSQQSDGVIYTSPNHGKSSPFAAEDDSQNQTINAAPEYLHAVPQHRRHLSFEGVGVGSMDQRQHEYKIFKLERALEAAANYRTKKMTEKLDAEFEARGGDKMSAADREQYENALDRVHAQRFAAKRSVGAVRDVEKMLDNVMAEWGEEAKNLPQTGRPFTDDELMSSTGDNSDPLTNRMNKLLKNSGFVPEWVELDREIPQRYNEACRLLQKHWDEDGQAYDVIHQTTQSMDEQMKDAHQSVNQSVNQSLGQTSNQSVEDSVSHLSRVSLTHPVDRFGARWTRHVNEFLTEMKAINELVMRYNYHVPATSRHRLMYLPNNVIQHIQATKPKRPTYFDDDDDPANDPTNQGYQDAEHVRNQPLNYSINPSMSPAVMVSLAAPLGLIVLISGGVMLAVKHKQKTAEES